MRSKFEFGKNLVRIMDILRNDNVCFWRLAEFFLEIETILNQYVKEGSCIQLILF